MGGQAGIAHDKAFNVLTKLKNVAFLRFLYIFTCGRLPSFDVIMINHALIGTQIYGSILIEFLQSTDNMDIIDPCVHGSNNTFSLVIRRCMIREPIKLKFRGVSTNNF
jgi:hypothetical protein